MIVFRVERLFCTLVLAALLFKPWQFANAQCTGVSQPILQVVPLASVNLGDLIVAGELQNTTVYMTIFIGTSSPVRVRIEAVIEVRLPDYDDYREAGSFRTALFDVTPPGRNVLNTNFPNVIDIEDAEGITEVLDDLRDIGRPAGGFRFTVNVFDETGGLCGSAVHTEEITNPVLIARTGPADGSDQREENVVFSWTGNPGFESYILEVNVRNPGQSLEDALATNQPPIHSGSVGTETSVNLRNLALQRQVPPGGTLVWRVIGIAPGVGGGTEIPTDIGWFSILDPNSALMTSTVNRIILLLQQSGLSDLAGQLQGGEISLTGEFQMGDGSSLSLEELMSLLSWLEANQDKIISIHFE